MKKPGLLLESLLRPASLVFQNASGLRNLAFDRGVFNAESVGVPVLSVGNLTVGGTGKTPLVAYLARGFQERGKRVVIISRGYGGSELGPIRVAADGQASRFGDEPTWLARELGDVRVYIGRKRAAVARLALAEGPADIILSDDGFQHRWLKRNCDLVVLDATEPRWHYRPLPLGRMREGFSALARSQVVFINKTNLSSAEQLEWLHRQILSATSENSRPEVFDVRLRIRTATCLQTNQRTPLNEILENKKYLLLSGIARPGAFQMQVEAECGAAPVEHLSYPDHHGYGSDDLRKVESKVRRLGAKIVLTTEKDAVKLGSWRPSGIAVWVTSLEMQPDNPEGIYAALSRHLF